VTKNVTSAGYIDSTLALRRLSPALAVDLYVRHRGGVRGAVRLLLRIWINVPSFLLPAI